MTQYINAPTKANSACPEFFPSVNFAEPVSAPLSSLLMLAVLEFNQLMLSRAIIWRLTLRPSD
jgi:hypothetical protein